jgi:hypothetical protein
VQLGNANAAGILHGHLPMGLPGCGTLAEWSCVADTPPRLLLQQVDQMRFLVFAAAIRDTPVPEVFTSISVL